jgi:hypothetical protein
MTDITTLRAHLVTAEASFAAASREMTADLTALKTAAREADAAYTSTQREAQDAQARAARTQEARDDRLAGDAAARFYAAVVCRDRARAAVLAAEEAVA